MTTAPENLKNVRTLVLKYLDPFGLEPVEVGIVGDTAHVSEGDSYHLGLPEQRYGGYSAGESTRDKNGLCEYASALDIGTFSFTRDGKTHNLRSFSVWLVEQCKAGTEDTKHIREIIYSPDGRTVKRWDRLGKRSTGDSSHLYHTHISFFRDATKAGWDLTPVFRRYLTTIGILEDDTVTPAEARRAAFLGVYDALYQMASGSTTEGRFMVEQLAKLDARFDDEIDETSIVAGVLAGLPVDKIAQTLAAALPTDIAKQVAADLAARLAA